jgi:hypothetical protein
VLTLEGSVKPTTAGLMTMSAPTTMNAPPVRHAPPAVTKKAPLRHHATLSASSMPKPETEKVVEGKEEIPMTIVKKPDISKISLTLLSKCQIQIKIIILF